MTNMVDMYVLTWTDWRSHVPCLPDALTHSCDAPRSLARFYGTIAFNKPIGSWNTSAVKYMEGMYVLTLTDWPSHGLPPVRSHSHNTLCSLACQVQICHCLQPEHQRLGHVSGEDHEQHVCTDLDPLAPTRPTSLTRSLALRISPTHQV